jgi:hypothetical protein
MGRPAERPRSPALCCDTTYDGDVRGLLVILLLCAVATACGQEESPSERLISSDDSDPGVVHVTASAAIRPTVRCSSRRIPACSGRDRATGAARVADIYQDTMGFTVIGPDHFLGSGHPSNLRE